MNAFSNFTGGSWSVDQPALIGFDTDPKVLVLHLVKMINYEDIHKQARLLEGELDLKLTYFNKLCSVQKPEVGFAAVHGAPPLPSETAVEAASCEIQYLIGKLNHLNGQMSDLTNNSIQISAKHTMQRHGEILQDYRKEFGKIQENFKVTKERQTQLGMKKNTGACYAEGSALSAEANHLLSSEILIDSQLNLAQETRLQLLSQRKSMKKLHTRLRSLYHRLPVLNDLIRRIELSKQKRFAALVIIALLMLAFIHVNGSNKGLLF